MARCALTQESEIDGENKAAAAAASMAASQTLQGGTTQSMFYKDLPVPPSSPAGIVEPTENPNALPRDGPKVCSLVSPVPSDADLAFLAQMGVTHAFAWFPTDDGLTVERLGFLRARVRPRASCSTTWAASRSARAATSSGHGAARRDIARMAGSCGTSAPRASARPCSRGRARGSSTPGTATIRGGARGTSGRHVRATPGSPPTGRTPRSCGRTSVLPRAHHARRRGDGVRLALHPQSPCRGRRHPHHPQPRHGRSSASPTTRRWSA